MSACGEIELRSPRDHREIAGRSPRDPRERDHREIAARSLGDRHEISARLRLEEGVERRVERLIVAWVHAERAYSEREVLRGDQREISAISGRDQGEIRARSGRDQREISARLRRDQGEIRARSRRDHGEITPRRRFGASTRADTACTVRSRPTHLSGNISVDLGRYRQTSLECRHNNNRER